MSKCPRADEKFVAPKVHLKRTGEVCEDPEDHKRYEIRILAPETEIMKETPWSRIRGQNSVYKEFLEIVGNGNPTGTVLEETVVVSVTILISVEK